ncbi:LamG-like jellyroll fold domain-containing protein [Micromonospora sp. DT31]|uniref:LamG domain-containing protein n=1 Tax=Micromonospora sp. DT31 TaxID=3393434 RepID=UPI003CF4D561
MLAASASAFLPAAEVGARAVDACSPAIATSGAATASTEKEAQSLADACDVPVEVLAQASETTKVFAQPSGDFEFESWSEPRWTKRNGTWRDIDTTLVVGDDGLVRPVAATVDVAFSRGGTGPFARMAGAGADFSLGWPTALPTGVINGDSITYPNVYPGVDLVVRAESGGFSHLLVVHDAAAAQLPAVRETRYVLGGSAEVTEADGGVTITGPEGLLAAAPPAKAWDSEQPSDGGRGDGQPGTPEAPADPTGSTDRGPGDSATVTPVEVDVNGSSLTVSAAAEVLESPHFPIFIDPTYDKRWARWAPVNDSRANTQWTSGTSWPREVARVGSNWDDYGDIWRSHFYFDTSALAGRRLTGTTSVDAYLVHTGWCAGESIGIWQTNSVASNTPTWNGMKDKWLHGGALQTKVGKANSGCTGQKPNWLSFNASGVGRHVQRHADENVESITFGLRMATESGGHWAKFDPANVKLKATYAYRPTFPVAIRTAPGGNCDPKSPGPWINQRNPTLYGKAIDGDGSVKIEFDLNGPTSPAQHTSAWTTSRQERGWTAPTLTEGNYNWRVRGTDTVDTTGWTANCYFSLDHTPPTAPVVTRTSGAPVIGQPVTLVVTSSDARSGMKQFAYGIGVDAKQSFTASTGTTTITFTPTEAERNTVFVWAQDKAGNYSTRTNFNFYTGRITEAQPQGVWRLDGTGHDDTGQGRSLTVPTGLGYGPDRDGRAGAALTFDGAACAAAPPVARTDDEYTVAGWVKVTDKSVNRVLAAQVGSSQAAFQLQHNGAKDAWELVLSGGDVSTPAFATIAAPTSTPLGLWQHVAATVDPIGKLMRLYLDGRLVAEAPIPFPLWKAESRFLLGCTGDATTAAHPMHGSIDHVGVWQGLLSSQLIARAATELPAGLAGRWLLHGDGAEDTERSPGLVMPEGVSWIDDQYGRQNSAATFDGTRCAATQTGPVLRTDKSFSVAAWVKLNAAGPGNQSVLGQDGTRVSGWYLGTRHSGTTPYWSLMTKGSDDEGSTSHWVGSPTAITADVGRWTHLTGVYDASAQTMKLYVNGDLGRSVTRTDPPWHAGGAMTVGCALFAGTRGDHLNGAVSDVRVWHGALTDAEVGDVHGGNPPVKAEALWPLDGPESDTPTYLTDVSGNRRDLAIQGPYSWTRDRGFGRDGALGLELTDGSCAETTGPTVRTDASFTVTAWVVLDDPTGRHAVLTQASSGPNPGFFLGYDPGVNRWRFEMATAPDSTAAPSAVASKDAPEPGAWTHLAGVYDMGSGQIRLYVGGQLQAEEKAPSSPWMAGGPTLVGCGGSMNGTRNSRLGGVVDDVRLWTSTLSPDRISALAAG